MFELLPEPSAWALLGAFAIDRALGELPECVHPVVWMGRTAQWFGDLVPRRSAPVALLGGAMLALLWPLGAAAVGYFVTHLDGAPIAIAAAIEALLLSTTFAVRALGDAVRAVEQPLSAGDLDRARTALRSLCSRDPMTLDGAAVGAAALESVAENASDSFVAPLLYYALFGLPGALAYRVVNTLDAMFGYRGTLEQLGKAPARLDDLANLAPARLTAMLLWMGALGVGGLRQGVRVWRRDARNTESPNAGHPMAMMSGLLGVELSKAGAYTLGAGLSRVRAVDLVRGLRIVYRASWLALVLCLAACVARGGL